MTTTAAPSRTHRLLAGMLSVLIGLGPVTTPTYAAVTKLADEPLNVKNSSKPNITMTVDDSTSMLNDFLPDFIIDAYCRDTNGIISADSACGIAGAAGDLTGASAGKYKTPGYIFQQYNYPFTKYAAGPAATPFDVSGPGAGCDTVAPHPVGFPFGVCSPGINAGASPGLPLYPQLVAVTSTSPKAGRRYEYNLLWPAPVHNGSFNRVYYNPKLTYEPPAYADGTSYPTMNAANSVNWTQVPADPWATTIVKIDLTASVIVGQWCNSDWTQGNDPNTAQPYANDPSHCRTNGLVAAASNGAPAASGDYLYPWVPVGMSLDTNLGYAADNNNPTGTKYTIGQSLAYSKVDSGTNAILAAWSGGVPKDAKYFYENDNVLWCDKTNPLWPQGGTPQAQTCTGGSSTAQTCGGGNAQTCAGTVQTCGNQVPQTCVAGSSQTCNNIQAQTCNGYYTQTCANQNAQTCNGSQTQTCVNMVGQTCNNYRTQTCDNIVPVQNNNCAPHWTPVGCDACGFLPECPPCNITTQCPVVNEGKCTFTMATCTAANEAVVCTPLNGTCSASGAVCQTPNQAAQCPPRGNCSVQTGTACINNGQCPNINGACSQTNAVCNGVVNNNPACPPAGRCSVSNAVCTGVVNNNPACPTNNGRCSINNAVVCQPINQAAQCPPTGRCSVAMNFCTIQNCPVVNSSCSITGAACTNPPANNNPNCPPRGQCSSSGVACQGVVNNNPTCPIWQPKCSITMAACVLGNANNNPACPNQNMKCSITMAACSGVANNNPACPNQNVQGTCSISMAVCTTNANCPNVPTASASAVCSTMLSNNSMSLLQDANTNGVVCRRNNKTYGATTADRFNYPSGVYKTPVTAGTGANACVSTPRFRAIPRHYWKTSVEWCDQQITTAGDQWKGYGTPTGGSCQAFKDATHLYPRFYQFGAAAGTDNVNTPAFQRVDLNFVTQPNYTHTFLDDTNAVVTINRTFVEEAENYANWFAYYRTRIQAVKTVTSLAFLGKTLGQYNVDNSFRVGFHTLSNVPTTSFVNIQDFTVAQKTLWATQLYGIEITMGKETPNLSAIERIGEYYLNGTNASLAGSTDPIVLSCQKNWHMLFTDGITNQDLMPPTLPLNVDNTVPALPLPIPGFVTGANWPAPFRENSGQATSNSASDYVTKYWALDFRTAGAMATNNVSPSTADPATWQHQNFAALSLGTEGKLAAGNQAAVESQLQAGTLQWTDPYPTVNKPDASGVDDLWHASINGRGQFVNADDADELKAGMGRILADVLNSAGSRAGTAFQGVNLSATNNHVYRVKFEPGWGGSLAKILIDTTDGTEISQDWDASAQLALQLLPTVAIPTPWFDNRRVVTMRGTTPVRFLWGNLSVAQQDSLAPGNPVRGQLTLEYLRGSKQNEGSKASQFRGRQVPLGDIVNSQAIYVGPPNAPYNEGTNPGYKAFTTTYAGRDPRIYVGANDGMMHAFNDATGDETFAYIPKGLFRPPASAGLAALTFQQARLPPFKHHYYVDSTPRVVDIEDAGVWRTILVGGMGKGGNSYYAIDITRPADLEVGNNAAKETAAAGKVMWEFTDPDLGYTYGRVTVAKTAAFGGRWLVIVPSGHNNASGVGKVWFLDAITGLPVGAPLSTNVGTPTDPAGLSQLSGYTRNVTNLVADQVYAGDLLGNLWRFDLRSANYANWTVEKLAVLTESGTGLRQPVTTPPQIEIDIANGFDRWVFVGTGRLLHEDDLSDLQGQTMYAIRDGLQNTPSVIGAPLTKTDLIEVTDAAGLAARPDFGWFDDLPPGSRIVVPPQAVISIVTYAAALPQTDPCLTGQPANIYAREFSFGNSVIDTSDVSNTYADNSQAVASAEGAVGSELITVQPTGPPVPGSYGFDIRIGITRGIDGKLRTIKLKLPPFLNEHRMSWRLLGE